MIDYILLLLLSVSPSYSDNETWEERNARMTIVATAIDQAASWATCTDKYVSTDEKPCKVQWVGSKKDLAILLVTKGYWESRFAKNVHEGRCKKDECDPLHHKNGTVTHRARTSWQMQKTSFVRKDEWETFVGADQKATSTAASVAARILSAAHRRCQNGIYGALSGYAGNMGCAWSGVAGRFTFFKQLKAKTEAELKSSSETQKAKLESRLAAKKNSA